MTKSTYHPYQAENERLRMQNEILENFDADVYKKVLDTYPEPAILDIGCGIGTFLHSVPENKKIRYIGIDRSGEQITKAQKLYAEKNLKFYALDVETGDIQTKLKQIIQKQGISAFDVIHFSMVLLHLNDPGMLLQVLYPFLAKKGTLLIRDIDDGLNYDYPDGDLFDRIYTMTDQDAFTGDRHSGRKIYTELIQSGYTDICLERQGLTTAGMTLKEKSIMYEMIFPAVLQHQEEIARNNPEDSAALQDYLWLHKNMDAIKSAFLKPEHISCWGFMTFTAHK